MKVCFKTTQKNEFKNLRQWWTKRETNEQAWKISIDDLAKIGCNLDIKKRISPKKKPLTPALNYWQCCTIKK